MAYDQIVKKATTSYIIEVMLRDSTTGQGKTSVAYGDVAYGYWREGAATGANGTCVTMSKGTYADHGWVEVDATNLPGVYQFGVPDAAIATGVNAVTVVLKVSGAIDCRIRLVLVDIDVRDAVRAGLTALPNAVPAANGGLPTTNGSKLNQTADLTAGHGLAKAADLPTDFNTVTVTDARIDANANLGEDAIEAIVDGLLDGGVATAEQAAAIQAKLITSNITVSSPSISSLNFAIIRGDDYNDGDGRALEWSGTWPDISGGTAIVTLGGVEYTADIISADAIQLELTAAETGAMAAKPLRYSLVVTQADADTITLASGTVFVSTR